MTKRSRFKPSIPNRLLKAIKRAQEVKTSTEPECVPDAQTAAVTDAPVHRPTLAYIAGMKDARRWGERLARDYADYQAGVIQWHELDSGALLYGPPGTGKTLFARALAETCGVRLIATSFAQWISRGDGHLGDFIQAMKDDFQIAEACECIILIDEIDSFPARGRNSRSDSWWHSAMNALLEFLSGIAARPGVVVIAACNHFSMLDPALLRAGRLETHIPVHLPTIDELPGVIRFHLSEDEVRSVGNLSSVAVMCQGLSPADIGRLVRDARRNARTWKHSLREKDFIAALTIEERDEAYDWRIAIHEAGHAVVALHLGLAKEVNVSLIANGGSAGTSSMELAPLLLTPTNIANRIAVALSGRAAEEVILGEISGGAGGDETSDLGRANTLAWRAVTELGFSKHAPLRWVAASARSEHALTDSAITKEVQEMLHDAYASALALINENREKVEALARALVDRRALAHRDIENIVGGKASSKLWGFRRWV